MGEITLAVSLMRAADKVRSANRKVSEAEHHLKKALKARERAEAKYLALVPSALAVRAPGELNPEPA